MLTVNQEIEGVSSEFWAISRAGGLKSTLNLPNEVIV